MDMVYDVCKNPATLKTMLIFKNIFNIVLIIVPLILIVRSMYIFIKPVISGNSEDIKKNAKKCGIEVFISILIFFIPTVIPWIIDNLTGTDNLYEVKQCMAHLTQDEIKYYEKIYNTLYRVEIMKTNPTKDNIDTVKNLLESAKDWAKEEDVQDFYTALTQAEIELNKKQEQAACAYKHGIYKDGYCFVNPSTSTDPGTTDPGSEEPIGDFTPGSNGGNGTTVISHSGRSYIVVNTQTNVSKYSKSLKSRGVSQDSNEAEWGSKCLSFAYTHAYGLYTNNLSYTGAQGAGYTHASYFTSYVDDSKQSVLNAVYTEVSAGRPCILQVNGNLDGTSRHYVTVVGYKEGVTSGSTIKETDLIIIDSWDGSLKTMDERNARFMVSGADCHKSYTGYQMYYLRN